VGLAVLITVGLGTGDAFDPAGIAHAVRVDDRRVEVT
jgi:hypothetical protein